MIKMPVTNWGKESIDLRPIVPVMEIASTQIHFKEDGAIGDTPSILFLCETPGGQALFHQMSMETLETALARLGYRLTRLKAVPS